MATLPTDSAFAPDIQCRTSGQKLYVAAQKLTAYGTLGTAVATTESFGDSPRSLSFVRTVRRFVVEYAAWTT